MHNLGAFLKLGLQELSDLNLFNSGLHGRTQLFFVYLLLLSKRWARLSNSMGDSSSLVSGGHFNCRCEDIIRRPDQFQNNAATLSGNFFPFIWSDFNSLTINKNFIFLVLNCVGPGWLQNYFSFMNEQFDFLLAFKLLSKDSKVVLS